MVEKNSTEAVEKAIVNLSPEDSKSFILSNRKPDLSPKLTCKSLNDSFSFALKNQTQSFDLTTKEGNNEIELTAEKNKKRNKDEVKLIVQKSLKKWIQAKKFKLVINFFPFEVINFFLSPTFRFGWKI